jgi:hypothetical protein
MSIYGEGDYNIPSIKRAIVRYLLTAAKVGPPKGEVKPDDKDGDKPKVDKPADPVKPEAISPFAMQARSNLDKLRLQDPKTVKEAERFFFLQ